MSGTSQIPGDVRGINRYAAISIYRVMPSTYTVHASCKTSALFMGDKENIYRDIAQIDQVSSPGKSSEQSNQLSVSCKQYRARYHHSTTVINQYISILLTGQ